MSQGSTTLPDKGVAAGNVGVRRCRATCAHHRARRARKDGGGGSEENNNNYDKPLNFSMRRCGGRATTTSHCTTRV